MTLGLKSQVHQFADDTNLLQIFSDPVIAANIINHDLSLLSRWAVQWRVSFNPLKTHFLLLSLKHNKPILPPIVFNNIVIQETPMLVSLGVTITQNLSWNEHVFKLIDKANKRLFILRKYKYLLPRIALERIYISMIRPVLEFGNVIYDSMSLSTGRAIETIQRQAAIIITGAYRHTSHDSLLSELGWQSLSVRRKLHKLLLFYKIIHRIYPDYLYSHLSFSTQTQYSLRTPRTLVPRFCRLSSSYHSFFPSTTREWNILPITTQNSISVTTFKALINPTTDTNVKYNRMCNGNLGRWLSRLRMGLSALNQHRFGYNFIQSPQCMLCRTHSESTFHYFFQCPTHRLARIGLFFRLESELGINNNNLYSLLETILFGKNISPQNYKLLLDIVNEYLNATGRFL